MTELMETGKQEALAGLRNEASEDRQYSQSGSQIVKRLPSPGTLSTSRRPP